jgi:NAD(P)-dependent dehydrogenase (short-subunit alcohol dehydrogenase family)
MTNGTHAGGGTTGDATRDGRRVWLITGCSTGFGRELARAVLDRGDRAAVTARDPRQVEDLVAGRDGQAVALRLDVTDAAQREAAVRDAEAAFGRVDVLVNNAGIGYFGAVEESERRRCGACSR